MVHNHPLDLGSTMRHVLHDKLVLTLYSQRQDAMKTVVEKADTTRFTVLSGFSQICPMPSTLVFISYDYFGIYQGFEQSKKK